MYCRRNRIRKSSGQDNVQDKAGEDWIEMKTGMAGQGIQRADRRKRDSAVILLSSPIFSCFLLASAVFCCLLLLLLFSCLSRSSPVFSCLPLLSSSVFSGFILLSCPLVLSQVFCSVVFCHVLSCHFVLLCYSFLFYPVQHCPAVCLPCLSVLSGPVLHYGQTCVGSRVSSHVISCPNIHTEKDSRKRI